MNECRQLPVSHCRVSPLYGYAMYCKMLREAIHLHTHSAHEYLLCTEH